MFRPFFAIVLYEGLGYLFITIERNIKFVLSIEAECDVVLYAN
jgi:hypothetical protein